MKIFSMIKKIKTWMYNKVLWVYVWWIIKQDELTDEMQKMVDYVKMKS